MQSCFGTGWSNSPGAAAGPCCKPGHSCRRLGSASCWESRAMAANPMTAAASNSAALQRLWNHSITSPAGEPRPADSSLRCTSGIDAVGHFAASHTQHAGRFVPMWTGTGNVLYLTQRRCWRIPNEGRKASAGATLSSHNTLSPATDRHFGCRCSHRPVSNTPCLQSTFGTLRSVSQARPARILAEYLAAVCLCKLSQSTPRSQ